MKVAMICKCETISRLNRPEQKHPGSLIGREPRMIKSVATSTAKNGRASLSGRKKAKVEDDDDFEFDDAGLLDEDLGTHETLFTFLLYSTSSDTVSRSQT